MTIHDEIRRLLLAKYGKKNTATIQRIALAAVLPTKRVARFLRGSADGKVSLTEGERLYHAATGRPLLRRTEPEL